MERPKCLNCGGQVIWNADFDYEDYGIYDEEGVIQTYTCQDCGAFIEVYVPSNKKGQGD